MVKEKKHTFIKEGNCNLRRAPCSTFKIAISLMGYDSEILIDEDHRKIPFNDNDEASLDIWKQDYVPKLWIRNSCVWYSQILTKKLGMKKFKEYIVKFEYGNRDVSGDKGKNNGLTNSWLSGSLEISPEEQLNFLQKLISNALPVSKKACKMTRSLLFVEKLNNGWELYGKTGSGSLLNKDRTEKTKIQMGWFIGWVQKNDRKIIFVYYLEDEKEEETYASLRAKSCAKENLIKLIKSDFK